MKHLFSFLFCSILLFSCKDENRENEEAPVDVDEVMTLEDEQETSEFEINPISHATMVMDWGETNIYVDPVGGAQAFEGMEPADFVLITDIHGDHMDAKTLDELNLGNRTIIAPQAVKEALPDSLTTNWKVVNNGEIIEQNGISIEAIPMYNLREEAKQFHPKGRGNGYVLEKDGERIYVAGDTEDIPEMRNLQDIDVAFIPMNLPYTMPVEAAADAVIAFAPKKVYPYHFRGQNGKADVEKFKRLVNEANKDIEVVLDNWYPGE